MVPIKFFLVYVEAGLMLGGGGVFPLIICFGSNPPSPFKAVM